MSSLYVVWIFNGISFPVSFTHGIFTHTHTHTLTIQWDEQNPTEQCHLILTGILCASQQMVQVDGVPGPRKADSVAQGAF